MSEKLVEVRRLRKHFLLKSGVFRTTGIVHAVDDIDFDIYTGETLGLVGESGCGKTTTGLMATGLLPPTSGNILIAGTDLWTLDAAERRKLTTRVQMVFQDPYGSLDPRMTVGDLVGEPLLVHKIADRNERSDLVKKMLDRVGLSAEHYKRYPHEFSGGQAQRIGIARALILNPKFVVADEPVSALDVSVRAQILNLLRGLQQDLQLTYLFITHDLSVVRHMSDRIAVMYLGKVVEVAEKRDLFDSPKHPYTQALVLAVPIPDPKRAKERKRKVLFGDVASPVNPPPGCRFHTRCLLADEYCKNNEPPLVEVGSKHLVACHRVG
jgi:oligopeptide/dipeptide ABC transporter ATP-binding protein